MKIISASGAAILIATGCGLAFACSPPDGSQSAGEQHRVYVAAIPDTSGVTVPDALRDFCAAGPVRLTPDSAPPQSADDGTQMGIQSEDALPDHLLTAGLTLPLRCLVRNAQQWHEVWTRLKGLPYSPPPVEPTFDFSQEMVLIAAMGSQPTTAHRIRLDSLRVSEDTLTVIVRNISLPQGCGAGMMEIYPAEIVRIPRRVEHIRFAERLEVRPDCNLGPSLQGR